LDDLDEWKRKHAKLEADLDACRTKLSNSTSKSSVSGSNSLTGSGGGSGSSSSNTVASTSSSVASSFAAAGAAFDADAAKAVFGKKIKENDLTLVEGIGPKIQELFHNHDVKTWKALSECTVDKCKSVLESGGSRFQMHDPGTWPKQAGMAAEGKWAELLKWQDEHDGGKA